MQDIAGCLNAMSSLLCKLVLCAARHSPYVFLPNYSRPFLHQWHTQKFVFGCTTAETCKQVVKQNKKPTRNITGLGPC